MTEPSKTPRTDAEACDVDCRGDSTKTPHGNYVPVGLARDLEDELAKARCALSEAQRRADDAQAAESIAQLAVERVRTYAEARLQAALRLRELVRIALFAFTHNDCVDWSEFETALDETLWLIEQESDDEAARDLAVGGVQLAQAGGNSGGMPLSVGRSRPDQTATSTGVEEPARTSKGIADAGMSEPQSGDAVPPATAPRETVGETTSPSRPPYENEIFHSKQERLEAVARRICEADGGDPDEDTMTCSAMPTPNGPRWLGYLPHAAAVLDMLDGVSRHQVRRCKRCGGNGTIGVIYADEPDHREPCPDCHAISTSNGGGA